MFFQQSFKWFQNKRLARLTQNLIYIYNCLYVNLHNIQIFNLANACLSILKT